MEECREWRRRERLQPSSSDDSSGESGRGCDCDSFLKLLLVRDLPRLTLLLCVLRGVPGRSPWGICVGEIDRDEPAEAVRRWLPRKTGGSAGSGKDGGGEGFPRTGLLSGRSFSLSRPPGLRW